MKLFTVRNGLFAIGLFALFGCEICDNGDSSSIPPLQTATIRGFWPCIGTNPTEVQVFGSNMNLVRTASIGPASTITQSGTAASVRLVVPGAAATGAIVLYDGYGRVMGASAEHFTVGADTPVPEIEPNEDVATATPMGPRTQGTGTLANALDRDHFRRDCFMLGATYSVTVNPRVVDTVFVNGIGVALDANGRGTFQALDQSLVFGLTGGTGAYTMTVGFVNP